MKMIWIGLATAALGVAAGCGSSSTTTGSGGSTGTTTAGTGGGTTTAGTGGSSAAQTPPDRAENALDPHRGPREARGP